MYKGVVAWRKYDRILVAHRDIVVVPTRPPLGGPVDFRVTVPGDPNRAILRRRPTGHPPAANGKRGARLIYLAQSGSMAATRRGGVG